MLHTLPFYIQVTIYSYYGHDIPDLNLLIKVNHQMFANYIDYLYDHSTSVAQFDKHKKSREKTMSKFNFVIACLVADASKSYFYNSKKKEFVGYFYKLFKMAHKDLSVAINSGLCKYESVLLAHIFTCDTYYMREFGKYLTENLRSDREFIMKLIMICPTMIEYASNELKNDKNIVTLTLINNFEMLFKGVHDMKTHWNLFSKVGNKIRNDKNYIYDFVTRLCFWFPALKDDQKNDITLYVLKNASKELIDDKGFVKTYLPNCERFYSCLSEELRDDEEIFLLCPCQDNIRNIYTSARLYDKYKTNINLCTF